MNVYEQQLYINDNNELIYKESHSQILIFVEGGIQSVSKSYIEDFLDTLGVDCFNCVIKYVDNTYGYKHAMRYVKSWEEECIIDEYQLVLVTNMTQFLNPIEFNTWSKEQEKFLTYIVDLDRHIHNVHDLTDRELCQAHNLEVMYRNGEFDE